MRTHLITRILAGVATLTVAGSMALASPAAAEPNSTVPAKKGCVNPDGGADLPHGTVWNVYTSDGRLAYQYKCNDGTWDTVEQVRTRGSRRLPSHSTAVLAVH